MQYVTVLGATGSIGQSTIDVLLRHPDRFQAFALTAHRQKEKLLEQCLLCVPIYAVLDKEEDASWLQQALKQKGLATEVLFGSQALMDVASANQVDSVMAAIVGAAGLQPTLAAVKASKKVLLANKESLVMAGHLFMQAVEQYDAVLLPIDSEHNAIYQCLPAEQRRFDRQQGVSRILLTGSGGPFRLTPLEQLAYVTPEQACAHPNWSMGRKISVDSATMMNKGLELIEACWMFDTDCSNIDVVLHPQSIIHSMVQYQDGTTLAQMGNPDMRTPIAYGLAWPERIDSGVKALDFYQLSALEFSAPDYQRFPCLRLAEHAWKTGKTAAAVLNAANEETVAAFLDGKIAFTDIAHINEQVLEQSIFIEPHSLADVIEADRCSRQLAQSIINKKL